MSETVSTGHFATAVLGEMPKHVVVWLTGLVFRPQALQLARRLHLQSFFESSVPDSASQAEESVLKEVLFPIPQRRTIQPSSNMEL